jgi:hypothetical protein
MGALDIQAVLEYRDGHAPSGAIVNRSVLGSQTWRDRISALRSRLAADG